MLQPVQLDVYLVYYCVVFVAPLAVTQCLPRPLLRLFLPLVAVAADDAVPLAQLAECVVSLPCFADKLLLLLGRLATSASVGHGSVPPWS